MKKKPFVVYKLCKLQKVGIPFNDPDDDRLRDCLNDDCE